MLVPLFDRVLLKRDVVEKIGAILLPINQQKRLTATRGVVVSKGPGVHDDIEVGRTYIFGQHAGAWINAEGKPTTDERDTEFFVLTDTDLICEVIDE